MSEALDFVGDFLIQETTGSVQSIVLLRDRALPYRPFSLQGKQRVDTTWYTGSPVGSQQVHGAMEMSTTINGKWSDRYIADTTLELAAVDGITVSNVRELTAAIDGIRKRGTEVLVQWMHVSRRGIISSFTQKWQNFHDVEWEIEFEWSSTDDGDISNLGTREFDLSDLSASFANDALAMSAAASPFLERLDAITEQVNASVGAIEQSLAQIDGAVASYLEGGTSAVEAAKRALALIDRVSETCDNLIAALYSVTDAAASGVTDFAALIGVSYGRALRSARATRDLVVIARSMRRTAAQARTDILRTQNPDLMTVFMARYRTDLREVSVRYYGTPNHWHALQTFNNLTASYVDMGAIVLVPRDPTATGGC